MKRLAASLTILAGLLAVGCGNRPVSKTATNNPTMPVDLLFNHDGCNVYRFSDGGEYHYYAVCGNLAVTTNSRIEHSNGKTMYTTPEEIATVQR